jgi:hypothetical protein
MCNPLRSLGESIITTLLVLGIFHQAHAQDLGDLQIPSDRMSIWRPGVEGGIPDTRSWPVINARTEYGAVGDGNSNDSGAIQAAINAAAARTTPTVVLLPAGTYYVPTTPQMRSNVLLRGEGKDRTRLLGGNGSVVGTGPTGSWCAFGALQFCGTFDDLATSVNGGLRRGSSTLAVASTSGFSVGDFVRLSQNNDPSYIDVGGNTAFLTHIAKVVAISGNSIVIDLPLRHDFDPSFAPMLRKMSPVYNAGVEDLKLEHRTDAADNYQGLIIFKVAVNSWVKNV